MSNEEKNESSVKKENKDLYSDNNNQKQMSFSSTIKEINPIVTQLIEFGYEKIYSRRVFQYLKPNYIDEALNYMDVRNRIVQHRFVKDRKDKSNQLCYICGYEEKFHLKERVFNINVNSFDNNNNKNNKSDISEIKSMNSLNDISFSKNDVLSNEKIECIICNEEFIVTNKNKVQNCGHSFCNDCWYNFLSIKIQENKISSIKCLEYECKEKLKDEFIINLLDSNIDLIKKYKRYKLELSIINDPNKKLCPYPDCDSYLEMKNIRIKDVTCLNNHKYCFICLKKPHGKLPCDKNIESDLIEYAKNNFIKKCPNCSIITEKIYGCNHITCIKCGYQWCWLCNQKFSENHFKEGKCKGFQFFQPKNDYEAMLVMEGKIKVDELSNSQRQMNDNDFVDNNRNGRRNDDERHIRDYLINKIYDDRDFDNIDDNETQSLYLFLTPFLIIFIFLCGHCLFLYVHHGKKYIIFLTYATLTIPFFFQLAFMNFYFLFGL